MYLQNQDFSGRKGVCKKKDFLKPAHVIFLSMKSVKSMKSMKSVSKVLVDAKAFVKQRFLKTRPCYFFVDEVAPN
jgi:hypothetical protein